MTKGDEPVVRRLLPVLPPLDAAGLISRGKIYGPVVDGKQTTLALTNPTKISGELTVEMASVLKITVEDPTFALLRNPLLDQRLTFTLGTAIELRYIADWVLDSRNGMGGVSTAGTSTVLTFWSLGEGALKGKTGRKSWPAAHMNFEAWVGVLADDVTDVADLEPVVPRPGSTPPRDTDASDSTSTTGSDGSRGSLGWSTETAAKVTVKGEKASPQQLKTIDRALRQAVKKKATARGVWAMGCANIGEADCKDDEVNSKSGAKGLFQLMPPPDGWQARMDWRDVEAGVDQFLGPGFASNGGAEQLAREHPQMSPGTIASLVEGSDANGAFYDEHAGEARRNIELWSGVTLDRWHTVTGPAGTSDPRDESSSASARPTSWRIGSGKGDESYWTGLGRTCEGLGRRRFVSARRLVAARDQDLILAAPHMVLAGLTPLAEPVIAELPQIDLRGNAKLTQISLRVFASGWTAPHGAVVHITNAGSRVDRAWLVKRIGFTVGDPELDVDLQQPTTQIPSGGGSSKTSSAAVDKGAAAAIKWAEQHLGLVEQPAGSNGGPQVGPLIIDAGGTPGQAWCGWFCRGALLAAGLTPSTRMAAVAYIHADARAHADVFRGVTTAAHARPGDLAIFGPDSHVGLVHIVDVTRGQIETLEGNTSNMSARRIHKFSEVTAIAQVDYTKAKAA